MNDLIKKTLDSPGGVELKKYLASKLAELRDITYLVAVPYDEVGIGAIAQLRAHEKLSEIFDELGVKDAPQDEPEDYGANV